MYLPQGCGGCIGQEYEEGCIGLGREADAVSAAGAGLRYPTRAARPHEPPRPRPRLRPQARARAPWAPSALQLRTSSARAPALRPGRRRHRYSTRTLDDVDAEWTGVRRSDFKDATLNTNSAVRAAKG